MQMRILVAEDDADEAEIYKSALALNGHSVTMVLNGRRCLDTYRYALHMLKVEGKQGSENEPYDVVVIDYSMPELDGLRVAKEIVKLNPRQRIILASAFVKDTLVKKFKDFNRVFEIIQKPFEPERLLELVENASTNKSQEISTNVKSRDKPADIDNLVQQLKSIQKRHTT